MSKHEEKTNCKNCGAPLHYDETSYGSTAKCEYCDTEYYIDKLGRVKDYAVKIRMGDKIIHFYLEAMQYEPRVIDTTYIGLDGYMRTHVMDMDPNITLTLHSYAIEEVDDNDK